jgi:hypothetical protein
MVGGDLKWVISRKSEVREAFIPHPSLNRWCSAYRKWRTHICRLVIDLSIRCLGGRNQIALRGLNFELSLRPPHYPRSPAATPPLGKDGGTRRNVLVWR